MSDDQQTVLAMQSRLKRLEQIVAIQQIVAAFVVGFLGIVILDQVFSGLLAGLTLVLILIAVLAAILTFISVIMGALELWSPSGRLNVSNSDLNAADPSTKEP